MSGNRHSSHTKMTIRALLGTGPDREIPGELSCDTRTLCAGDIFFALPGVKADGSSFAKDAVQKGACAIVLAKEVKEIGDVPQIILKDPREALAHAAARFYRTGPDNVAAVTGTNGKTSIATFVRQLWEGQGRKAASIGTLGVQGAGVDEYFSMTTPDPVRLHKILADLGGRGVTHLSIEASSHGLIQHRLDGLRVKAAAFTNLTRDHLDYHPTMEDYFTAKSRLFTDLLEKDGLAVINGDDPWGIKLCKKCEDVGIKNILTYGHGEENALRLMSRTSRPDGQNIEFMCEKHIIKVDLHLVGAFQAENALCALALAAQGDPEAMSALAPRLADLQGAPGRLQLAPPPEAFKQKCSARIYVDYAHTPDSLENALRAVRPHVEEGGRLLCIAGCGGDRDRGKRPLMGKIAATLADLAIITDDNPRTEDPVEIRAEMLAGIPQSHLPTVLNIGDRRDAIRHAVRTLQNGDILVIAGKGHEDGQIVGTITHPFNDLHEAIDAMEELNE